MVVCWFFQTISDSFSRDAFYAANCFLAEQRIVVLYRLGRWSPIPCKNLTTLSVIHACASGWSTVWLAPGIRSDSSLAIPGAQHRIHRSMFLRTSMLFGTCSSSADGNRRTGFWNLLQNDATLSSGRSDEK